jgi:hypothetical protein
MEMLVHHVVAYHVLSLMAAASLYSPAARDAKYKGNWAQYLVDLHDSRGTFDFCGGMMFELNLSPTLRAKLLRVSAKTSEERAMPGFSESTSADSVAVRVFGAETTRMHAMPGYTRTASADSCAVFHGREVRTVVGAAGGMQLVLHLSDSAGDDAEGWSREEIEDYNGWGHDSGRPWRNTSRWQSEGVSGVEEKFGPAAYGLHHRFFLHLDRASHFWLSAEDGCEGYARAAAEAQ